MNEFNKNEQMELLLQAKQKQPDLYAQLPATTKMSLGIYESTKPTTNGLSADEHLRLAGLRQRITTNNLSSGERISLALKISELEAK
jgi:protocatechuate 3,4-dioxygenase beta subunit